MNKQKLEKLPKWAQSEIIVLGNKVRRLNNELQQFQGKQETNTFILQGLDKTPLPNNSDIEFSIGAGYHNKLQCKLNNGILEIFADSLQVLPKLTNHIHIKFGR